MPAQSKQQQKFMGLVHAIQKGDVPTSDASPKAQKVAKDMKPSDVKDFASTSHKGLPKKVKQEILKKLKEYAMTLPGHHSQPPAPMDSLRSDDEMDVQEDRIPQNFNVGTTRDYHTKLATTPREKYDKTNFKPAHSGQEDLIDDEPIEEAQAVSGGKVHKFITGKNLGYKGKKYSHIEFETLGVDNKNGTIRLKVIAPKEIFGNEMSLDFRTVRRGAFFKTDTSKVHEYGQKQDLHFILNNDAKLDGTPEEKDAIDRNIKSVKESSPCWDGYKQVGMKNKGGKQVPNCVKESVNESTDTTSLKKIHDAVFKFLKTKKGVGEVKEFSEFPNRYGDNVSTFSVKYNIEDKYNYDLQEIKIEYSTSRVFIPNKGYFPFKTFNDIKNIINKKSSLKESVNETSKADIIKDLDKAKNDLLKKVDVLIAKKKKLYSNVDIESPMTADEKKLDKDIADLFSQLNKLVLQKRSLKEYGQALDLHFILNKDAKLDGTPEDKKAIGEELSFDEKQMVAGIIEILKQVEDRKNRMKIALNMLKKFKEEGIEFDYQKFIDSLKEYSMGSYEYDKGNRELGEAMMMQAKDMVYKVIPKSTFARFASNPPKNREFVDSIIRDLTQLLNRFYKQKDIDLILK